MSNKNHLAFFFYFHIFSYIYPRVINRQDLKRNMELLKSNLCDKLKKKIILFIHAAVFCVHEYCFQAYILTIIVQFVLSFNSHQDYYFMLQIYANSFDQ